MTHAGDGRGLPPPGSPASPFAAVGAPRPEAVGHVVRGAHFYVWDEDPREASSWGEELAASESGGRRPRG